MVYCYPALPRPVSVAIWLNWVDSSAIDAQQVCKHYGIELPHTRLAWEGLKTIVLAALESTAVWKKFGCLVKFGECGFFAS